MPIIPIKCKNINEVQKCKTGVNTKSKFLSNLQQTRYPTPKRSKELSHNSIIEKNREGRSLQLPHQNSSQPTEINNKMSRLYISTPLTCQSDIKPRTKKQCAAKDKYKRFSHKQAHSIVTEVKSSSDADSTSVTIYNNYSGSMFPQIREADSIRSRKSSDKPIIPKKNPAGVFIPPKILDFHPYIGLTPEMMHAIDYV